MPNPTTPPDTASYPPIQYNARTRTYWVEWMPATPQHHVILGHKKEAVQKRLQELITLNPKRIAQPV